MLTDNRVEVAGQEGSLEASVQSINDDSERDQEAGGVNAHPGEGIDDGRASEQEHGCDDDVGEEAEAEEHDVRCRAPSRPDDLADGVRCRRFPLDFNGQHSEEQHLHQTHTHTHLTNLLDAIRLMMQNHRLLISVAKVLSLNTAYGVSSPCS